MTRTTKFAALYAALLCTTIASLSAGTFNWDGKGSGGNLNDWNKSQNWIENGVPALADQAIFTTVTAGRSTTPTISVATQVGEVTFNSGAQAFNISGTSSLQINGIAGVGLANAAGDSETFSVSSIILGANQTWNNDGTLTVSSGLNTSGRTLTLASPGGTGQATFSGIISGAGGLAESSGTVTLSGNNTYTGGTAINGGTLRVGSDANLGGAASALSFNGGTLNPTANLTTSRGVTLNAGGGTIDSASAVTLSGIVGGAGSLTKQGSGALTLSGANTYSGGTILNTGALDANNASALGSGAITLNAGDLNLNANVTGGNVMIGSANLNQNTSVSSFGGLTVAGNGTINVGASGSLTFSSASYASGLLNIGGWNGPAYDANTLSTGASGSAAIFIGTQPSDTFLANVQFQGVNGPYPQGAEWLTTGNGAGELVPVPEPQVYAAIFGLGLLGFALARRRLFASA